MEDEACQQLSLAVGEPLAGTAIAEVDRFLLLEHDGPWGARGIEDSGLSDAVVAHLRDLGASFPRLRVQLVRRPRASEEGVQLFLAEVLERGGILTKTSLANADALSALPLAAWLEGKVTAPGERMLAPHYFVCVHGKRDRCCARLGMPVYTALEREVGERVYQTTHLGGHRFAATLLVLPSGLCYGRVSSSGVRDLVAASERGDLYDLTQLRGRTLYPSAAQAAEIALRKDLDHGDSIALSLRGCELRAQHAEVRFAELASGREHVVNVRTEPLPAAPASCGAKAKVSEQLIASLVR